MSRTLLIGYGNPLRRDDGVGPLVAERFAGRPGITAIIVHQLLPELADELADCGRVVFVDAAAAPGRIAAAVLEPSARFSSLGHACDPAALLALADALHGARPRAWLVTIPAHDLGHGEGLSEETCAAMEECLGIIGGLLEGRE